MNQDYKGQVKALVLNDTTFLRLTAKGQLAAGEQGSATPGWRQVNVRPVEIKHERYLQFSYLTQKQDITKNYRGSEASAKLDELLALPFSHFFVQATTGDLQVQLSKNGRVATHFKRASAARAAPDLAHDASKQLPLPGGTPDAFLQATGIMDAQGQVRPRMQDKFTQINEFLKLLEHTRALEHMKQRPVHILDCGCGSAYLSFAVYHYLNDVRHMQAELTGIDINAELIAKDNTQSKQLGFANACFRQAAIIDYQPEVAPDIVLALHACDTATDEALVQGIRHAAQIILCAPCCHHHLQKQLHAIEPLTPVFHDGILAQRMGDILTDTFRALALRIMGYKTDVVEFVSPEHTDKNLLIRAVRQATEGNATAVREYVELKRFWGVTPYIETLLGAPFLQLLEKTNLAGSSS